MNVGLALSGGGAKGAAHIGVLQALEEENVNITHISGTSSGSIIATLYSVGYSPKEIAIIFNTYCKYIGKLDRTIPFRFIKSIFTGKINIKGFSSGENLEKLIYRYCQNKGIYDISKIKLPLAIPAVNLKTENVTYYLSKRLPCDLEENKHKYKYFGNISSIVRASSSFPGVFVPKRIDNEFFIDGGVSVNTPVNILKKMGAEYVIAVSFDNEKELDRNCNILDIILKSFEIMGQNVNEKEIELADLNIVPKMSSGMLLDCSKAQFYMNAGYIATKKAIKQIKEEIK